MGSSPPLGRPLHPPRWISGSPLGIPPLRVARPSFHPAEHVLTLTTLWTIWWGSCHQPPTGTLQLLPRGAMDGRPPSLSCWPCRCWFPPGLVTVGAGEERCYLDAPLPPCPRHAALVDSAKIFALGTPLPPRLHAIVGRSVILPYPRIPCPRLLRRRLLRCRPPLYGSPYRWDCPSPASFTSS